MSLSRGIEEKPALVAGRWIVVASRNGTGFGVCFLTSHELGEPERQPGTLALNRARGAASLAFARQPIDNLAGNGMVYSLIIAYQVTPLTF